VISAATAHAFQTVREREADVMRAYTSGAQPLRHDVAQPAVADFTLDPLSATAPRDSYFVVADESARFSFTRDGAFGIRDGTLVDSSGRTVYGYRTAGGALAPLRVGAVDVALGLSNDLRIEPDGNVTLSRATIDPRSGVRGVTRETIGRIALGRFAPGSALAQIDAAHFAAPPGVSPHLGRPADGNFAALTPNRRERSGIDIDAGLERLQEAYLAVDALRAAEVANRGVEKTAMDLLK
jgi:flagellar basal body rod protein FlgG